MFANKKLNLYFTESKFYYVNFFNSKIRVLFRKLDKLDFFYSKILNQIYKILKFGSFFQLMGTTSKINEEYIEKVTKLHQFGFVSIDKNNNKETEEILEYGKKLFSNKEIQSKLFHDDQKKKFLRSCKIDLRNKENFQLIDFLFSNNLLNILSGYFNKRLILKEVTLLYSENKEFEKGRSQEFHMDGDDQKQIKLRLNVCDINYDNGPLTVINKSDTKRIFKKLSDNNIVKKKSTKVDDKSLFSTFSDIKTQTLIGKEGSIDMVDTSNCYHYGSRPGNKPRLILEYQFLTPFSYNLPFFCKNQSPKYLENFNLPDAKKEAISNLMRYYSFKD